MPTITKYMNSQSIIQYTWSIIPWWLHFSHKLGILKLLLIAIRNNVYSIESTKIVWLLWMANIVLVHATTLSYLLGEKESELHWYYILYWCFLRSCGWLWVNCIFVEWYLNTWIQHTIKVYFIYHVAVNWCQKKYLKSNYYPHKRMKRLHCKFKQIKLMCTWNSVRVIVM